MKNFLLSAFLLTMFAMMTVSCGKSNKVTPTGTTGHTVKFTITVAGSVSTANAGLIDLAFNATGAADPTNTTLWKVNGVEQKNEALLNVTGTDFPQGKTTTIVIESVVPLTYIGAGLEFGNVTGFPVYTISYKAEIDGKVQNDDENISITGANSYDHDYNY